jgi:hypothetical protein
MTDQPYHERATAERENLWLDDLRDEAPAPIPTASKHQLGRDSDAGRILEAEGIFAAPMLWPRVNGSDDFDGQVKAIAKQLAATDVVRVQLGCITDFRLVIDPLTADWWQIDINVANKPAETAMEHRLAAWTVDKVNAWYFDGKYRTDAAACAYLIAAIDQALTEATDARD